MQHTHLLLAALLAAPLCAHDGPSGLDRVTLKSGDTLVGRILALDAHHVTIDSAVFGTTTVPLADVADVSSSLPLRLHTSDGRTLDVVVERLDDGTLRFADGAAARELLLADLAQDPVAPSGPTWKGSVSIGATFVTGNNVRRSASAAADAKRESDIDRITLGFSWNYAEDKDPATKDYDLTQRRTAGSAKYDYKLSECDYAFASVSAENDRFQDLDLRIIYSLGLGRSVFDKEHFMLRAEAGLAYFDEQRKAGPDSEYFSARGSYNLEWQACDDVKVLQDVEVYPSLEESNDVFVRKVTRAQLTLTEKMFAEGRWELDYDNTPSPGLDRIDHRFFVQVGWSF